MKNARYKWQNAEGATSREKFYLLYVVSQ